MHATEPLPGLLTPDLAAVSHDATRVFLGSNSACRLLAFELERSAGTPSLRRLHDIELQKSHRPRGLVATPSHLCIIATVMTDSVSPEEEEAEDDDDDDDDNDDDDKEEEEETKERKKSVTLFFGHCCYQFVCSKSVLLPLLLLLLLLLLLPLPLLLPPPHLLLSLSKKKRI